MSRLSHLRSSLLNAVTHLFGYDVFIEADAPSRGLLDFQKMPHGASGTEFFGLGFHVVVSSLDYVQASQVSRDLWLRDSTTGRPKAPYGVFFVCAINCAFCLAHQNTHLPQYASNNFTVLYIWLDIVNRGV